MKNESLAVICRSLERLKKNLRYNVDKEAYKNLKKVLESEMNKTQKLSYEMLWKEKLELKEE